MQVAKNSGSHEHFDVTKIQKACTFACKGLNVSQSELEVSVNAKFFDGMRTSDIQQALITTAAELISVEKPDFKFVAARLLLQVVYKEVTGGPVVYPTLQSYIERGIQEKQLDPRLAEFDLPLLGTLIDQQRDLQFDYLGLQSVYDRYLIREEEKSGEKKGKIIELPQHFFMRVAMGLALRDNHVDGVPLKSEKVTRDAADFYDLLSSFDFMSSTPTLFNSGTFHPQLSSCYLNTVADALYSDDGDSVGRFASIYGTIEECARLSKYAGGIGTDWTRVRPAGSIIRGTNGRSAGTVPYIKVWNDTAVAVNQGGKRNGAFAPYMEPWHPDFLDFIELRKNSGDELRRAHQVFPAAWIPDLLMKRVQEDGVWSFFASDEYPELHELYGEAFEARYIELEGQGAFRDQMSAKALWQKMLTSLFETGHPWITFKDPMNERSPQQHVGVIHNSNLCTEIALNTSDEETAVCNLGSVNLARHVKHGRIDLAKLERTVSIAVRMLDNVVDINFYPSKRAEQANMRHRPVGLGMMGLTDMLAQLRIDWESQECVELNDEVMEAISYFAIIASANLARERGSYSSFNGSLWSKGILPIDTAKQTAKDLTRFGDGRLNWNIVRELVKGGMRNSNVMALAPTATISNIIGVTPTIEPPFELEYTKTNLSGQFLVAAPALQYGFPVKEAFDIDQTWVIKAAAVRQKWIDQAQSVNLFVPAAIKGRDLSALYMLAWLLGLKTTYYLRRKISATASLSKPGAAERVNPVDAILANPSLAKPAPQPSVEELAAAASDDFGGELVQACSIDNPNCTSCQ